MPTGPRGEKRPADVVGCAVHVAKIATGEFEEALDESKRKPLRAKSGRAGGKARAAALSPAERSNIAVAAAAARWGKDE